MAKYYVFPMQADGKTVLMSVKPRFNPYNGGAAFLARLANPIGGNDDGRPALATVQAEAQEETRGKVTINNIAAGAFHSEQGMSYYISASTMFAYNPLAVLSLADTNAIRLADQRWNLRWQNSAARNSVFYRSYVTQNYRGLTLLENTGEVATLDLTLVDTSSDVTTATTINANAVGIADRAGNGNEYLHTVTLNAIRRLATWVQLCQLHIATKDVIRLARQRARSTNQFARAHRLQSAIDSGSISHVELDQLMAEIQRDRFNPVKPPIAVAIDQIRRNLIDLQVCHTAIRDYSPERSIHGVPADHGSWCPELEKIAKFARLLGQFVTTPAPTRDQLIASSDFIGVARHRFGR